MQQTALHPEEMLLRSCSSPWPLNVAEASKLMQMTQAFAEEEASRAYFPLCSSIGQEATEAGNQFGRHEAVSPRC